MRCVLLTESARGHLRVLGVDPCAGVRCTWITDGDCPGNLSLGQHTGDGKFDGETFLGRTWMFFLGGTGEGKRNSRARAVETFSQDDASSKQPCLCYILYVEQWGFHCSMSSGHCEGGPRSSIVLGRHVLCSNFDTRRPSPRIEDGETVVAPRSATDSTEQWV